MFLEVKKKSTGLFTVQCVWRCAYESGSLTLHQIWWRWGRRKWGNEKLGETVKSSKDEELCLSVTFKYIK